MNDLVFRLDKSRSDIARSPNHEGSSMLIVFIGRNSRKSGNDPTLTNLICNGDLINHQ